MSGSIGSIGSGTVTPLTAEEVLEAKALFQRLSENPRAVLQELRFAERSRALLKRIEWNPVCPVCRMYRLAGAPREGHTDDCELAALLAK